MTGISGSGISDRIDRICSLEYFNLLKNKNGGKNHNHNNDNVLPHINKVGGYFFPGFFK